LHELTNRVEDHLELTIVSAFQFGQFARQIGVAGHQLAKTNERSHDLYVDEHGTATAQNRREHRDTLLGERVWRRSTLTAPT
jgi:hypothetical protein